MISKKKIKNVFLDSIHNILQKDLEALQDHLIAKERSNGLSKKEKIKLWKINKVLFKK